MPVGGRPVVPHRATLSRTACGVSALCLHGTEHASTVAQTAGGYQPLSAIYRRQFAVLADQALRAGSYKIDSLFPSTITQTINEEELKAAGFSQKMFRNLNTLEELADASENTNSP